MTTTIHEPNTELASALAERLREAKIELVRRWLDRITARVTTNPAHIFPSDELLDHVPLLIEGIADFVEGKALDPDLEIPVAGKARELGALRHAQGFDAYEILKEHELLAGILFNYLGEIADEVKVPATRRDLARCWHRVSQAVEVIRQTTMMHFLHLSAERVREREERLRRFNRMVSHELKNHVGAIKGAAVLLREPWLADEQRVRFQVMISDNAAGLERVLTNLEALSRLDSESRQRRNVLLPQAAAEAARQLRRAAEARGVKIRIAEGLPRVEVDAAVVELSLVNYLSNAIKYSDASKKERWVEIRGELQFGVPPASGELIVRVRDNGIGVPPEAREQLYEQFFRAHGDTVTGVEGSGLGLSIVRETVESMDGRAWAEFPDEGGTVFAFSLPSRREEDAATAGTRRDAAAQ
ncbi:MAG TPA: ATP-binding protein [Gemmatimonadaceae bacterium]|nr:ATP-binding protein [Gemmatimonadaceae bacterium]